MPNRQERNRWINKPEKKKKFDGTQEKKYENESEEERTIELRHESCPVALLVAHGMGLFVLCAVGHCFHDQRGAIDFLISDSKPSQQLNRTRGRRISLFLTLRHWRLWNPEAGKR